MAHVFIWHFIISPFFYGPCVTVWSHSFTATYTRTVPACTPQLQGITPPLAGTHCTYPQRYGQAEFTGVAGHMPK